MQEVGEGFQLIHWGALPIWGILYAGWEPSQMMIFLLVGSWVGAGCDVLKLSFLYKAVMNYANVSYDDWHVWVVAEALRKGKNKASRQHLRAKYQPELGVLVDVVFGGIGSGLIWITMHELDKDFPGKYFAIDGFRNMLLIFRNLSDCANRLGDREL